MPSFPNCIVFVHTLLKQPFYTEYRLDNINIRFGNKLYRQIVGNPMCTNCAPPEADLFLFRYERDFMTSLSGDNQADIIEEFNSNSRYLDDLLNIDDFSKDWSTKFIHLNCNSIKPMLQIPRHPFWIYIFLFLMVLFPSKFMINAMTLILILLISFFG